VADAGAKAAAAAIMATRASFFSTDDLLDVASRPGMSSSSDQCWLDELIRGRLNRGAMSASCAVQASAPMPPITSVLVNVLVRFVYTAFIFAVESALLDALRE
jgi:hypothetical protein